MSSLRRILIGALLLGLCGSLWYVRDLQLDSRFFHGARLQGDEVVQSGNWLFDYRVELEAKPIAGIDGNLSGLAWDGDRDGLWAVTNAPTRLFALDRDGNVERRIELEGFHDVEAVTYLGDGRLAVAEERRTTIVFFDVPQASVDSVQRAGALSWRLGPDDEENKGLEGLDYDALHDRLLVVKERDPRQLLALTGVTAALATRTAPAVVSLGEWLGGEIFARDLSSVVADPRSGHLLLLSDESSVVMELSGQGEMTSFSSLLGGRAGLDRSVPQAEGMALDHAGTLFIASEPNLFYRFALPAIAAEKPLAAPTGGLVARWLARWTRGSAQ